MCYIAICSCYKFKTMQTTYILQQDKTIKIHIKHFDKTTCCRQLQFSCSNCLKCSKGLTFNFVTVCVIKCDLRSMGTTCISSQKRCIISQQKILLQGLYNFDQDTFFNDSVKLPSSLGCHTSSLPCCLLPHFPSILHCKRSGVNLTKQEPPWRMEKEKQLLQNKLESLWCAQEERAWEEPTVNTVPEQLSSRQLCGPPHTLFTGNEIQSLKRQAQTNNISLSKLSLERLLKKKKKTTVKYF